MGKVKIKLNRAGVRELLKSPEMKSVLEEHAAATLAGCGAGYESDSHTGKNRTTVTVFAKTAKARQDNAKNQTILRALK